MQLQEGFRPPQPPSWLDQGLEDTGDLGVDLDNQFS